MPALPVATAGVVINATQRTNVSLSSGLIGGIAAGGFVFLSILLTILRQSTKKWRAQRKQEQDEKCLNGACPWYHCWRSTHDVSLRHNPTKPYAGSISELEDLGCDTTRLEGLPRSIADCGDYLRVARGSLYKASCPDLRENLRRPEFAILGTNDARLKKIKKRGKSLERQDRSPYSRNDGTLPLVDSSCPVNDSFFVKRIFYQARFREPPAEELAGTLFPGRNKRNPRRDSETLTPQQAHARTMLIQEQAFQYRQAEKELEDAVKHCNMVHRQPALSDAIDRRSISSTGSAGRSMLHIIEQGCVFENGESSVDSPVYALNPREGESSSGVVGNGGALSRTSSNGGASIVPGESDGERGVFVTTFHPVDSCYAL